MTCTETGYRDEITCECFYVEASDTMDRADCPVHTDIDGERFTGGVCCRQYAETGRHTRDCGNWMPPEPESIPWTTPSYAPRRAPGYASIGNGIFVKTGRRA